MRDRLLIGSVAFLTAAVTAAAAAIVFGDQAPTSLDVLLANAGGIVQAWLTILLAACSAGVVGVSAGPWLLAMRRGRGIEGAAATILVWYACYLIFGVAVTIAFATGYTDAVQAFQMFVYGAVVAPVYTALLSLPLTFAVLAVVSRQRPNEAGEKDAA